MYVLLVILERTGPLAVSQESSTVSLRLAIGLGRLFARRFQWRLYLQHARAGLGLKFATLTAEDHPVPAACDSWWWRLNCWSDVLNKQPGEKKKCLNTLAT